MTRRFILLAVALGFALVEAVSADDNVRDVQTKLRDGGFYSGEIDGAHGASPSNSTAAAFMHHKPLTIDQVLS